MKVNFQRDFHYGEGRFKERNNPNEVPDSMAYKLPMDAEIVDGPANPKRARKGDGEFKGDDKSTPDINEAWEGGKAPKKPASKKQPKPNRKA
jgi:hypothetical protein|tara:strand:- start:4913 stop:5188 length:276 start_codon:yes stop_codon:yes gene_type:complete